MTLSTAQTIVSRAIDQAQRDFKRPICVHVCDANGFELAFARMDGAPIRSIEISRRKAFTAVRIGVPTQAFLERLRKDNLEASWFGDDLCALPGGVPIKDGSGAIVGGVGISGLAASEDQVIAEAVAALVR
ncbi:MAG TPA: heme-binding protein [Thermoanaerobaculia bacterium]|nr:heme-binding protein [Thermoanaerobaculia bacterium]